MIPNPVAATAKAVLAGVAATAKAVLAGVAAGLAYLIGVISTDATLSDAFTSMTANQWIGLALTVLGSYGITWTVPNRAPSN